jgi:hypothetical protein
MACLRRLGERERGSGSHAGGQVTHDVDGDDGGDPLRVDAGRCGRLARRAHSARLDDERGPEFRADRLRKPGRHDERLPRGGC